MDPTKFDNTIDEDVDYVPPPPDKECLEPQNFPKCQNGKYSPNFLPVANDPNEGNPMMKADCSSEYGLCEPAHFSKLTDA